jgi:glycosyltransferase involved in cell wall biosynthesis
MNTVIVVNYNSSRFVSLILECVARLSECTGEIIITDNGSHPSDVARLMRMCSLYDNTLVLPRKQTMTPSLAHGGALDAMLPYVRTPYVTVMDADACFLQYGWDKIMIDELNGDCHAVGTPHAFSAPYRYIDFPLMYATMYKTDTLRELNCKFVPIEGKETVGYDTGWEIRHKFREARLTAKVFSPRSTRDWKGGAFNRVVCTEYWHNDALIASHFGRGSTVGAAKYFKVLSVPVVAPALRRFVGLRERQLWIQTARELIASQCGASRCAM